MENNLVIELANRAQEYRQKVSDLWYREDEDGKVSPEYKRLNDFVMLFEAGSTLLATLEPEGLQELAEEVFQDLITQNFVLDLQYYVFAPYGAEAATEVVTKLSFSLAARTLGSDTEGGRDAVTPADSAALRLVPEDIAIILRNHMWVVSLLLLPLATTRVEALNGTNQAVSRVR